jgi:hypothetical protein
MFFLISFICCLVEKITPQNNHRAVTYILGESNTVHFVQTQIKDLSNNSFRTLGEDEAYVRISIFKNETDNKSNLLLSDEKTGETNTFFFTTPTRDDYFIVFELVHPDDLEGMNIGIDYRVYSGDAHKPSIVSNNDVEVYRAENAVDRVFEFVKKNFNIHEQDEEQENFYKALYEEIIKKACFFIMLKIISTGVALYYTNKKTKSFYAEQGLGSASK